MKADQLIRKIEIRDRSGRVVGTKEVVTYPGLLSKAHEEGLVRVRTTLIQIPTEENGRTAIAKAIVETSKGRFEGLGDANPENVNSFIVPHIIRMAETRAKARAFRDAVNIGVVAFEELNGEGLASDGIETPQPFRQNRSQAPSGTKSGDGDGAPMTEAQRRYLFRLLAGQGLQGEHAHEHLKELLGVPSLKEATKREATALIDELLSGVPEEASRGSAQR
jgi:hypothetical protein